MSTIDLQAALDGIDARIEHLRETEIEKNKSQEKRRVWNTNWREAWDERREIARQIAAADPLNNFDARPLIVEVLRNEAASRITSARQHRGGDVQLEREGAALERAATGIENGDDFAWNDLVKEGLAREQAKLTERLALIEQPKEEA